MNKNKMAPPIRFQGFTGDWEQRKLGEIVQITMGQSPDGTTYSEEPSKYILIQGNADLKNGWVVPRIWTTQRTKFADAGDLIMSVRAPAGAMGKTAYDAVIGRGVAAIKGNEFIFQTLSKMDENGYWKKLAAGSTFESINSDAVRNAEIIIPSDKEQEKIGQYFLNLDNLITLHQRKLDQQKQLKKYFLQNMLPAKGEKVPKIRFQGFSGDWEQRKLGDEAIEIIAGGDVDKSKLLERGRYPVIANALTNDGIVGYYENDYRIKAPAVTVTGRGDVGHAQARKFNFTPVVRLLAVYSNHDVDFLAEAINQCDVVLESTGVPQLTVPKLANYCICFPPTFDEEVQIGAYLYKLDHLITLQQHKIDQLQDVKKFMLQNLFV